MKTALVDMDIPVYVVASACENKWWKYKGRTYESKEELNIILKEDEVTRDMEPDLVESGSSPESWSECKKSLVSFVENILDEYDDYKGFLSGKGNFRYKIATILPYKGNRTSIVKPYHYDNCRQFLVDTYGANVSVGYEADDAIGLEATEGTVIASTDKDLDCIPGLHYNWSKEEEYEVSVEDSYRNFFSQVLTGDTSDNILGLFGVGPKSSCVSKVRKAETVEDMITIVQNEYDRRFGTYSQQFLQENAMLLWILQQRENPLVAGDYWKL